MNRKECDRKKSRKGKFDQTRVIFSSARRHAASDSIPHFTNVRATGNGGGESHRLNIAALASPLAAQRRRQLGCRGEV
jgi:hypothetical protein